jgi:uncharacterized membrane protein (UPF0127 family)
MPIRSWLSVLALLAALAAGVAPLSAPARADAPAAVVFRVASLTVETASGDHVFLVEIADTPERRARGLMFRRTLGPDHGMLFDYREEREVSMWMKNTYVPLDMLFVDGAGRIVHIVERTAPLSTVPISSTVPVWAVLEVPGGTVARLAIRRGDRVRHPIFTGRVEGAR